MPKGKKRKAESFPPCSQEKPRRQIRISPLFKDDLKKLSPDSREAIKSVLREGDEGDFFLPGRRFKVLRDYKGRKIWYLRAGSDCRLTAIYDTVGNLWLLSIESHDTLGRAHKRVMNQVKKLDL